MMGAAAVLPAQAAETRPVVAVTIDFLDYVFDDLPEDRATPDYLPLELYEKRLRTLAECGVNKLYLRVNVCGLTLYPSAAVGRYGDEYGNHKYVIEWGPQRLINTLDRYDPLTETIRIGKSLGMEVWAWESLFDDAATVAKAPAEEFPEFVARYGEYPLMDPYFRSRPHLYAQKDPRKAVTPEMVAERNREAAGRTIGKIVFRSEGGTAECRVTPDRMTILTSDDNIHFTPYEKPFGFSVSREGSRNTITLDNLEIRARFVKLAARDFPTDDRFTMVFKSFRGVNEVYDTDGKLIPAVWGYDPDADLPERNDGGRSGAIQFAGISAVAWDWGKRTVGFGLGEPDPKVTEDNYFLGMAEFNVPEAMEHKLERFRELLKYDFDGFMFNIRSHSYYPEPDDYGFNPEVREKFLARYGRDILDPGFTDYQLLRELRADGIDEFFARCRQLTGGRPLYVSALPNRKPGDQLTYYEKFGLLPWHYDKWAREKSVDGVMMIGEFFPENFKDMPFRLGAFVELWHKSPEESCKIISELLGDRRLDELELYEAMLITRDEKFQKLLTDVLKQEEKPNH